MAVVGGYYAVSATSNAFHELNSAAGGGSTVITPPVSDMPPSITSFTVNPTSGDISTTFNISCSASDDHGISSITLYDGSNAIHSCSSSPCTYATNLSSGTHSISCKVTDTSGHTVSATPISVTVSTTPPDTTPPTVSANVTDLGSGQYTLSCTASDASGISSVTVILDNSPEKHCSSSPCAQTVTVSAGSHELNCVAEDRAGNTNYAIKSFSYTPCTDECTSGSVQFRCDGNVLQRRSCGNFDSDSCTEWSSWSDVNNCDDYDGKYGSEYRDYYCDSATHSCKYSVTCTDECTSDQNRCNGSVFQVSKCGNYDSDPCLDYGGWQDVNNCDDYDGWYGNEYHDYSCDTTSSTGCSYTVTQTCSDECTEGNSKAILCPKWVCQHLPGLPGCHWKLNWVICGYKHCKTTCDSDPCTEWC